jgi:hypothetical protein
MIRLFTGTDVDATLDGQVESEQRARDRMNDLLRQKISRMRREMQLVYPGS